MNTTQNQVESIDDLMDNFELSEVETRLEFGLYSWIGNHCGDVGSGYPPGTVCTW